MPNNSSPEGAFSEDAAAEYLGFTASALRLWRRQGTGPAFIRVNRSIRYLPRDLGEWQSAHRVEPREPRGR